MSDRSITVTSGNTAEERMRQAKRPATAALAGPYGHPLHPLLVTVPVGAWIASLCFDVASHVAGQAGTYAIGAYWLIALGLAGAVVAASVGVIDLAAIPTRTPAFRTALVHMTVMLGAVALYAVSLALRHADIAAPRPGPTSSGLLALSAVALGVVAAGGWLGGKLSFRYGVRVADEAVQLDGFTDHEGR